MKNLSAEHVAPVLALRSQDINLHTDCTTLTMDYHKLIEETANICAPLRLTNKPKRSAAWFSLELTHLKQHSHQIERRWFKQKTEETKLEYKLALKCYHIGIFQAKQIFYAAQIETAKNKPKPLFKIVHSLANPSALMKNIPPSQEFCEELAEYFINNVDKIQEDIQAAQNKVVAIRREIKSPHV